MTWWLVTDFDRHLHSDTVTAAWVEADDERAAAEAGADAILHAWRAEDCQEEVDTVFVINADERTAYVVDFVASAEVAELQCCGGIGGGRHSATCPTAREDEKGLRP